MELLQFVHGCTFDDFLFSPQCGVLPRRDPDQVDLSAHFSEHVVIKRPIVSANMDTITRAQMAVVLAEEGGIGVIDRGFRPSDIQPQVKEVTAVKRTQHGVISDPHTILPIQTLGDALAKMDSTRVGTLVVVDQDHRLVGLLTERDARFVNSEALVLERMTPRLSLVVHTGPNSLAEAEEVMRERKIKKLPLVDNNDKLVGLITAKDILNHKRHPFATRDDQGRLRVAAAVGATGDYLERADELIRAGADVLVIDIAHGHSEVMDRAIRDLRKRFGDTELIAGNVATAEGVRFLEERGVNGIKVGIGPGGGCTTRLTTNFGVPQVEALVRCRLAADTRVPLIADGGVRRDGSIAESLMFGGDCVMLGSVFAGTEEAPGEVVLKSVLEPESHKIVKVPFKVFRGMASVTAVRDRLDLEEADVRELEAIGAEGLEVSVPARGTARTVIRDMLKHLCSAISYGGSRSLRELKERFWSSPEQYLIRLTEASKIESFHR
ncbi:MAG: IMP dehydrogenase [Acidobacteria bacterium]|nr:MAG: IMP dehydrogenase [Acidobacteriota bacterium]PYV67804.1 MAG: IMP dehydrogenase [Acidobacteriota bacterium]